jgi:hypothetical protein
MELNQHPATASTAEFFNNIRQRMPFQRVADYGARSKNAWQKLTLLVLVASCE